MPVNKSLAKTILGKVTIKKVCKISVHFQTIIDKAFLFTDLNCYVLCQSP